LIKIKQILLDTTLGTTIEPVHLLVWLLYLEVIKWQQSGVNHACILHSLKRTFALIVQWKY